MAIALLRQTPERNLENPPKRKRDGGGTFVPPFLYPLIRRETFLS
ncbi:hypothetical protein LEP1GSC058_2502 [Leptospira fainei serovar Hurstbridge str. BUT 6]|uniref:Uncharacterized protein n=1 Tax=Leptospira fainei serovar Hurstbridge str. BUT 6 TaxID=1193011 RepID=S3V016_9LEPT|nr:hypothetical protein LEP1GSC058_2502 [Leptospira fainei serovar Hurstbridge str. BUT 6]